MLDCIAILETMWGPGRRAPDFFAINPENFTGRRLHAWISPYKFLVTNACPELVGHATKHGTPDVVRLRRNLESRKARVILVCGQVAKWCYTECGFKHDGALLSCRHPAARNWTREQLALARDQIQGYLTDGKRR